MTEQPSTRRIRLTGALAGFALAAALLAGACGGDGEGAKTAPAAPPFIAPSATAVAPAAGSGTAPGPSPSRPALQGGITVFAAASLTDVFQAEGKAFSAANPKATVTFNFAGSSALANQINQGAPADVFASADGANMRLVSDKGSTEPQTIFATNLPVVVVPGRGSSVASFEDLARPGVKLVLAAPAVPIGNYAREIFMNATGASGVSADFSAKVLANDKSDETDVRAVLAKVQTGEADAGVVYQTDATSAGAQVKTVAIPAKYNVIAEYPIAVLKSSAHLDVARAFAAYITSDAGQALLKQFGFGPPAQATAPKPTLAIGGLVDHPTTLTADQVQAAPTIAIKATDKDGTERTYNGEAIAAILKTAGVQASATQVVFTGSDGYVQMVPLSTLAADPNAVVIVDADGTLRNIIPTQPPRTWVKLLVKIEVK